MNDERANSFLRLIRRAQRGKLKIYLGYAAGVGKTFQMLQEAHRLKKDGVDVVVGLVDTHQRKETEALLEGLPIIPRKQILYHSILIEELDLNAILERRPEVVLIDELAHTNVPGCKNKKRHQDVEEILEAGIHVISALNVQHLESLYHIVEEATGVKVRERIPDKILVEADQIVNVDLTAEDLQKRLKEGKIYPTERIQTALESFFTFSNLEQLREISLREMAAQLDSKHRDPNFKEGISPTDQVMVCLSSRGPNSEKLLRYASRFAGRLNRNWYAVYVQMSSENPILIDAETQRILSNTLSLAKELGATVFTYRGNDLVQTLLTFAKEYRVGHLIIGKPGKKVPFWRRLLGSSSLVERLVEEGKNLTLIILDTREENSNWIAATPSPPTTQVSMLPHLEALIWKRNIEKNVALQQLLTVSCKNNPTLEEKTLWQAILQREERGTTFVGNEVLLPHTRSETLSLPILSVGISRKGIFDEKSGNKVHFVLLLLSPQQPEDIHFLALKKVSKLAQNDLLRQKILKARKPQEVIHLVRHFFLQNGN